MTEERKQKTGYKETGLIEPMEDKKSKCPICKKETTWEGNPFRPFCSERCRLMDLGKWASEEYRIAGEKKGTPEEGSGEKNNAENTEKGR